MNIHLPHLGTLVTEAPCHVFYNTRHQVYSMFDIDRMTFAGTQIHKYTSHTQIHTANTRNNRLTHKHILTPPVVYSHQLSLQRSTIFLLFKIANLKRSDIS